MNYKIQRRRYIRAICLRFLFTPLHEKDIYPKHPVPATIHLLRGTDSKGVYRSAMEHLARRDYGERWL